MIILIMGPQGSGKTTQAKILEEKLGIPFVSMGEILRDFYKDQKGVEADKFWAGELVTDSKINKILHEFFQEHAEELKNGFVMDGFPRTLNQYSWMMDLFHEPVSGVIYIELERQEILRRLIKRRAIEHRQDETDEAIETRLSLYEQETLPVLKEFKKDGVLVLKVDGSVTIEQIHTEIVKQMKEANLISNN